MRAEIISSPHVVDMVNLYYQPSPSLGRALEWLQLGLVVDHVATYG